MGIEIKVIGLTETLNAIASLEQGEWIPDVLRDQIPAMGQINKAQSDRNKSLPYSPGYLSKLKPSKQRRAGGAGDLGYGLDTMSLYSDALFSWDVQGTSLTNYSDLEYAGFQAALMEEKGSSFYADDELYYGLMESAIAVGVDKAWNSV